MKCMMFVQRQLKRGISILLAMAMALAFSAVYASEPAEDAAVLRAIEYGLVPDSLINSDGGMLRYSQFCELMRVIVEKVDVQMLPQWDAYAGRAARSRLPMYFGDVYGLAYYAACLLGHGVTPNGDWLTLHDNGHGTEWTWMDKIATWRLLPDSSNVSPFKVNADDAELFGADYPTAGYFWCLGQFSCMDSMSVLDADDARLIEVMTQAEGIAIAARLYESIMPIADTETCAQSQAILAEADAWKEQFFANESVTEGTGRSYYVSNSGSDTNSGLSAGDAWATLEKVRQTELKAGDTVLLERGDTWYIPPAETDGLTDSALIIGQGVTLGAYGQGARPVIRADAYDSSDAACWQLFYDAGGVKIWVFSRPLRDCPIVVFDGGEAYATFVAPHWNGEEYVNADGSVLDITQALDRDLSFCQLIDLEDADLDTDIGNSAYTGPLYLRCDAGNPAEVFTEVAIPQAACGLSKKSNATVRDLDIRYFTCLATQMDSYDGEEGMSLLDCEIGWCGGLLGGYSNDEATPDGVYSQHRAGGAIQCSGSQLTVRGNYIHDCGPMTCIISIHGEQARLYTYENIRITGNLFERCGSALHWAALSKGDNPDSDGFISGLEFSGNLVLYSGGGWIEDLVNGIAGRCMSFFAAIENTMGAANNDGIMIRDNVFYLGRDALIHYTAFLLESEETVNQAPVFSGNVYAQHRFGWLALWNGTMFAITQDTVENLFGDATGEAVSID